MLTGSGKVIASDIFRVFDNLLETGSGTGPASLLRVSCIRSMATRVTKLTNGTIDPIQDAVFWRGCPPPAKIAAAYFASLNTTITTDFVTLSAAVHSGVLAAIVPAKNRACWGVAIAVVRNAR